MALPQSRSHCAVASGGAATADRTLLQHAGRTLDRDRRVAFECVRLLQASEEPSVLAQEVMPPLRLGASVLAIAPVVLLQLQTRSLHPPAAATVLLIALRGFQMTWSAVIALLAGVTMIAVAAELVRWLRLKQPSQS